MPSLRRAALPLTLALALAACSSDGDAERTATPASDPCSLLTPSFVSRTLGSDAAAGVPQAGAGWIVSQCTWSAPTASVSIAVGTAASLAAKGVSGGTAAYVADRRAADAGQFTVVDAPEVGDGGYAIASRAPMVLAASGDVVVQLIVSSPRAAVDVAAARTLAAEAADRARP